MSLLSEERLAYALEAALLESLFVIVLLLAKVFNWGIFSPYCTQVKQSPLDPLDVVFASRALETMINIQNAENNGEIT